VDLDAVLVKSYLGFHVANVTVQRRRIQEHSLLEAEERDRLRVLPAR
jgi:hypothetical protein